MINYSEIVKRQRDFFNSDVTKSVDFRIAQLKKLQSLLHKNEQVSIRRFMMISKNQNLILMPLSSARSMITSA
jgi:aldehyde dehydrogenase (NAD+)